MFRRAVTHCIQEIGEAASQVGEATRTTVPQLPWRQVVGMRHNLVHVYFNIKHEQLRFLAAESNGQPTPPTTSTSPSTTLNPPNTTTATLSSVAEHALAMILSRHRLTVVPNVRIDRRVQVMLSPRHGLPMTIHNADGPLAASGLVVVNPPYVLEAEAASLLPVLARQLGQGHGDAVVERI